MPHFLQKRWRVFPEAASSCTVRMTSTGGVGCLLCAVVPTPASAACPPVIVGLSSPLLLIASLCWYGVHPCGTRPGSVNAAAKYDHSSIAIATWKITAAIATPATSAALAVEFGDRMALGMKSIGATTA